MNTEKDFKTDKRRQVKTKRKKAGRDNARKENQRNRR